jgi:hypothetical protein
VFLDAEQRRLPAIDGVAFGAFAIFRTSIKLPFVRIRCVTVFAVRKGELLFEVAINVASDAGNLCMLSE